MGGAAQPAPAKPILADTGACRATAIISEQLSKKAQAMPDSTGNCDFIALSNDSYRLLLDEVGAFVYTTDMVGRYTFANRMVLQLLGHPLDYVVGKDISHFFGDKGNEALRETDERVLRGGETIAREESNLILATGELRTYWSTKKPLRDATGQIIGMIGISHDITEKKRLEDKLRRQKELLDALVDNVDALIYMKDANRRFLYANRRMAEAFGCSVDQIIGSLDVDLMPAEVAERFWQQDQKILANGQRHACEESLVDASGRLRHYWSVIIPWAGPDGTPAIIGLSTDITELHALKEELQRQARADSLTGIANRRSFYENAELEFARSRLPGLALSLINIDIDFFKKINDTLGHPMGDRVLQEFVACCQDALRNDGLLARTGGEEFCILLPGTDLDAARHIAERIREQTQARRIAVPAQELRISASFGVAGLCDTDERFETLYSRADLALYAAKQQGRNRTSLLRSPAQEGVLATPVAD
jgi:diguanylate cyclase (GGDEF)-like protein/PAS domain S-box-containing protein